MHALAHLRQLRRYERQQRERLWADDDQPKAAEIQVGVLGLGVLGADAASKLGALGFRVAGWSASEKSLPGVACFHGPEGLKRLLAMTDMLIVLLPLTDVTEHHRRFAPPSAPRQGGRLGGPVLINAGRGGLQVEAEIPPRSIPGASRARRSMCSSASPCRRIRASGATPPSTSAPTTPPSRRLKPSPRSSPARSRLTNGRAAAPSRRSATRILKRPAIRQPPEIRYRPPRRRDRPREGTCFGNRSGCSTRTCSTR